MINIYKLRYLPIIMTLSAGLAGPPGLARVLCSQVHKKCFISNLFEIKIFYSCVKFGREY